MFVPSSHAEVGSSSSQLCRQYTFSELQLATQNFDESLVIGRGGFGKVYKGTVTKGPNISTVAIKRLDSTSNQGESEFWAEVNMLSNLRHCHLVSLIGYCNHGQEMILVYEYMSHGTLEDHLHRRQTSLSWVQRLTICIGAARGLDYLHTGTGIKDGVVHRDVKSSNILLHDSWVAKISDFGLSKICPKNQHTTYVNTDVKGTFGYLDPDYFYTGKLTRKSDVYAFGVVLFEALCGKRAVDRSIGEEQWGLAAWAQNSIKEGRLKQIVDTNITGSISPKCLKGFAQLAKRCLLNKPKQRPTMAEVVVGLEYILALEEKAGNTLQHTGMQLLAKKALMVIFPSNEKNLGGQNQALHRFYFDAIRAATENFSNANKIQQAEALDPFHKGKLQNGQGIAVARIRDTGRHEHVTNEASILVKLEHENLAKFLGYCIDRTNLYLVYDFPLHANSGDLIYDPVLNWDKRYKILLGVARALLYLHRDAPIRIVHGALNHLNILLDENWNPILSGFLNTKYGYNWKLTDVWTGTFQMWRYVDTEYLYHSNLTTKADVYSFGVLVLETITKAKHNLLDHSALSKYVLAVDVMSSPHKVETNWLEGTLTDIIDPIIDVNPLYMTRFLAIGLLCVQEDARERPTMEEVVSMLLDSSSLALLTSKIQAMVIRKFSNDNYNSCEDEDYTSESFVYDRRVHNLYRCIDDDSDTAIEEFPSDLCR